MGRKRISMAEAARQANVSRQAIFKSAKKLEERGYIETAHDENSSKNFRLTDKGKEYFYRSERIKKQIEVEISNLIGEEKFKSLKKLLQEE